jgi:hypothetical protein
MRPRNLDQGEKIPVVSTQPPEYFENSVFLNIPYDKKFRNLYLAYIAGIVHLGLIPRATFEITDSSRRLDKIIDMIRSCRYSIHDLSRVQLDLTAPRTPRFNMPFELGLAVAVKHLDPQHSHDWFVFESKPRRLSKSLSDLNGTDPNIHTGTVHGVMRELCNAFERRSESDQATVPKMMKTYREVSRFVPAIQQKTRAQSLYESKAFRLLYSAAVIAAGTAETPVN